ncbi:hypothetical protein I6A84_23920 [Frankia sp. CNm7]|uniref:DUF8175 domain-containing protein n=2 Tax=Frankia nepalensis TaxID=1836974 RepID=A0A937RIJ6_9ACTN|nr:hypothetical protein [Frankia nepalensis]MBL7516286.1 hypothetical protein [Frankia nepalensis]MBL7521052.1 hypothetical protein [Frankia nepalensis]MBL7630995.1 hypothetical protein [Frankia nepalensis]
MDWATRRLILVIAVTAIVMLPAGVGIGWALASSGSSASPTPQAQASQASTPPSPTQSTVAVVPSPSADGGDHTAEPAGSLPGAPSRVNEFGIPVGYPHTQAGAISACGNYVSAYMNSGNREPSRIRAVLNSISAADVAERLSKAIGDADAKTAQNFGIPSINSPQAAFNLRVVGYRVQDFASNKALIQIWATGSVGVYEGSPDLSPQENWGTDICTVTWNGEDWKLADAGNGPNGPVPTERASEQFQRFLLQGAPA